MKKMTYVFGTDIPAPVFVDRMKVHWINHLYSCQPRHTNREAIGSLTRRRVVDRPSFSARSIRLMSSSFARVIDVSQEGLRFNTES